MADIYTKQKRSEIMSLVRSKNTKPEIALRQLISKSLYPLGYRYRLHHKLAGRPDVAFVSRKVAVFVDGGFWHGFDFKNTKHKLEKKYWLPKIKRNMERDKEVNKELKARGWKVVRIWDHDVRKRPKRVLAKIRSALDSRL